VAEKLEIIELPYAVVLETPASSIERPLILKERFFPSNLSLPRPRILPMPTATRVAFSEGRGVAARDFRALMRYLRQVEHIERANARGRGIAIAAVIEPVVAGRDGANDRIPSE
jgi:hypothetical protein